MRVRRSSRFVDQSADGLALTVRANLNIGSATGQEEVLLRRVALIDLSGMAADALEVSLLGPLMRLDLGRFRELHRALDTVQECRGDLLSAPLDADADMIRVSILKLSAGPVPRKATGAIAAMVRVALAGTGLVGSQPIRS